MYTLNATENLLNDLNYDVKLETLFYIHGYKENLTTESTETVVNAYLRRNDHNVIVLNWGPYANGSYMTHAVPNLVKIGKLVGSSMHEWLTKEVFKLNELHIVGHSLGAHLGAYITIHFSFQLQLVLMMLCLLTLFIQMLVHLVHQMQREQLTSGLMVDLNNQDALTQLNVLI